MPDLLSIAPLTEIVEVRGAEAVVHGVPVKAIASLIARFPDLRKMWATGKFDAAPLLGLSDEVIGAVIAAGCANIDEENAANLALDEKAELLAAIIRVTMPRGPGPFMATLTALLGTVGGAASPTAPASKSRKPSPN
ncbi:MAG: hypothetical protein EOQ52_20395 [Mesorhizobium sp.]|uniref:phage pre-tape measure protein n=1 Tax=Mesorhizobium sp. TaxID=1871066 RepID=UPI000FE8D517|nr:hypothetical protein [Mesorhizobium sp.]RWB85914.1 MAG: hypothetical protein EOQ52_20395 [Mesorhizobium sp.]